MRVCASVRVCVCVCVWEGRGEVMGASNEPKRGGRWQVGTRQTADTFPHFVLVTSRGIPSMITATCHLSKNMLALPPPCTCYNTLQSCFTLLTAFISTSTAVTSRTSRLELSDVSCNGISSRMRCPTVWKLPTCEQQKQSAVIRS